MSYDSWKTSAVDYEKFTGEDMLLEPCDRCGDRDCECPELCDDCAQPECICEWDNSFKHPTTGAECFNVGTDGIYTAFSDGRSIMFYSYKGVDHPSEDENHPKYEARGAACAIAQRLFNEASAVAPIRAFVQFGRFCYDRTDRDDDVCHGTIEEVEEKMFLKIGRRSMALGDSATALELLGMVLEAT